MIMYHSKIHAASVLVYVVGSHGPSTADHCLLQNATETQFSVSLAVIGVHGEVVGGKWCEHTETETEGETEGVTQTWLVCYCLC